MGFCLPVDRKEFSIRLSKRKRFNLIQFDRLRQPTGETGSKLPHERRGISIRREIPASMLLRGFGSQPIDSQQLTNTPTIQR